MSIRHAIAIAALFLPGMAAAQQFTTAQEVRPILQATKAQWIAVRNYEGQDWLYFTNILSWRCGLSEIHFTVNDGDEEQLDAEECHMDTATPNAMTSDDLDKFLRRYPAASVQRVRIRLVLDDGTEEVADYARKQVEIP
jgi:hypothetical protein